VGPFQASKPDPHANGDRRKTIEIVGPLLLLLIHTLPKSDFKADDAVGRIISGRTATAAEQKAELTALAALPDDSIAMSDAPDLLDWSDFSTGL
jgi:hypothetical protein